MIIVLYSPFYFSSVGAHAKLIARLLTRDIPRFLIVYAVVAAAFLGAIILTLIAQRGFVG